MKRKLSILLPIILFSAIFNACFCQDTLNREIIREYDPHYNKIIPDKVIEFGFPLLLIFLIANTVVHLSRMRAETRLKEKAMDKQISEPTLIALFTQDRSLVKYTYLKWFLILTAIGISLIFLQLLASRYEIRSGYLALGIMSLFMALAFLIYYRIIRNK